MMTLDNRHTIARPYWARPGIRLATAPGEVIGAGEDSDELDDDDLDDDDDEDDDPDEGKSEDELRAELKAVRKSLGKANGQSARNRKRRRELEAELSGRTSKKPKANADDDDEVDIDAIRAQAQAEGKKAGEAIVKRSKVEAALAKAGITDDKTLARLARGVDLDDLDLNDDGTVDGLDEVIDELREDLPALFEKPRRRRTSVAGPDDRDGGQGREVKPKSASEQAAAKLLGRGRS